MMFLSGVTVRQFRNFEELSAEFPPGLTLITGANAQGKTNFIEAIYVLSRGGSFRAKDHDLVKQGEDFYAVSGQTSEKSGAQEIAVRFLTGSLQKTIKLNGTRVKSAELMSSLPSVLFTPDDLRVVYDDPARRRLYLDTLLGSLSLEYASALARYRRALSQRGHMLYRVREGFAHPAELEAWDLSLIKYGRELISARHQLAVKLTEDAKKPHRELSERDDLELTYQSILPATVNESEYYRELERTRETDIKTATTAIGPHRDDLLFTLGGKPMPAKASRGEVKTALLALKLTEIKLLTAKYGTPPVILLDDVLSELDSRRQEALLAYATGSQTFITATHGLPAVEPALTLTVEAGELKVKA